MNQLFDFLFGQYAESSTIDITLELVGVFFGLLGVWYGKKESILVYPLGLINTIIFVYICLKYSLYGDTIINVYYTIMSVYGWYMWSRMEEGEHLKITKASKIDLLKAFVIFVFSALFIVVVYLYFNKFNQLTDYFDTITTGLAFSAMWLMANKKIEHWVVWVFVNVISVPMYYIKGLRFTALQFLILLIIAILGHIEWKKHLNKNPQIA